jgi:glutamate dehydrogenase/leucine dehydrogenase
MDLANRLQGHTNLYVSDIRRDRVAQATALGFHEISETDRKFVAVYAPCAIGQVINAGNLHGLTYSIICGSANNQLADASYAEVLRQHHVLYAPDYLVNAGGVISGAGALEGWSEDEVGARCDAIGTVLLTVLKLAEKSGMTPLSAANMLAEARLV